MEYLCKIHLNEGNEFDGFKDIFSIYSSGGYLAKVFGQFCRGHNV